MKKIILKDLEDASDEESTSSDLSDKEYTPNSTRNVNPPKRKLVEMAQPPIQEEEPSDYEKIRANVHQSRS